jgi:sugar phosphate isomerase/epimerase
MFPRPTAADVAAAFVDQGLVQVQLNLSAIGQPTIPTADELSHIDLPAIRQAFDDRERQLWGVSATYNVIHPDPVVRARGTETAANFIRSVGPLRPVAATLSTGSRDTHSMWTRHPDNDTEDAWNDMRASLDVLLAAAEESGVLLAIEPEPGNVVADSARARRLAAELGPDARQIGFILDPANLVSAHPRNTHAEVLREAFDVLGDHTICMHAKDTVPWSDTLAGDGVVNYELVLALRDTLPTEVPLIIQDATPEQVPILRERLRETVLAAA